jgi:hypothetical protein
MSRTLERIIHHGESYRGNHLVLAWIDVQIGGVPLLRSFPHGTPTADIIRFLEGEGVDCSEYRRRAGLS